eukprot:gene1261-4470_t
MKLLEIPEFANLSTAWSGLHNDCRLICTLQAYSCKMAGDDKKLYKQLAGEGNMDDVEMLAPPTVFSSVVNDETEMQPAEQAYCTKKTLYYLKSTLNAAYSPDYDFSHARGTEFALISSSDLALQHISAMLSPVLGSLYTSRAPELRTALERVITPGECDVFLYCGDSQDDPFTEEGTTWSFAYMFYNKKLKRMWESPKFTTCPTLYQPSYSRVSLSRLMQKTFSNISAPLHDQEIAEDLPEELLFQESSTALDDEADEDAFM